MSHCPLTDLRILVSYLETVMSNTSTENEALIKDLMYKCDCLYRENSRLREKVSAQPLGVAEKEAYELQLSEKIPLSPKGGKDQQVGRTGGISGTSIIWAESGKVYQT